MLVAWWGKQTESQALLDLVKNHEQSVALHFQSLVGEATGIETLQGFRH